MTEKIEIFPGTPLGEEEFAEKKVLFNHDELKGDFAWDTGIAIGSYLAGLKAGVILGARCSTCRRIVVPPRVVCEWCFRPMDEYVPLQEYWDSKHLFLCYVTWDVKRIKDRRSAVIEIDGASPLHGIMHMLKRSTHRKSTLVRVEALATQTSVSAQSPISLLQAG
jgi:uncharacterized OB-fold protein